MIKMSETRKTVRLEHLRERTSEEHRRSRAHFKVLTHGTALVLTIMLSLVLAHGSMVDHVAAASPTAGGIFQEMADYFGWM